MAEYFHASFCVLSMLKCMFYAHTSGHFSVEKAISNWDGDLHQVSAAWCLAAFMWLFTADSLFEGWSHSCKVCNRCGIFLWSGKCQSWYTAYWFQAMLNWIYMFPALSHINTKHTSRNHLQQFKWCFLCTCMIIVVYGLYTYLAMHFSKLFWIKASAKEM